MSGHMHSSIADLLFNGPQADEAIAIEAPGRKPLTYKCLRDHIGRTVEALNAMGYGRNDRIAAVLPNGPEMAVLFLSVAAGFTFAPLNPLLQKNEFEVYLKEIGVKSVIVLSGETSPAIATADFLGISIIELTTIPDGSGLFTLTGERRSGHVDGGFARDDDIALILHTSGTTSRPKMVPLTQSNVCYAAWQAKEALGLNSSDRCLNVMPLYYIHGLVGALLSSLGAGGSVVCTPGFLAPEFVGWLDLFKPTWYTASPAIHQKALDSVKSSGKPVAKCLRVIRSAAAPLPLPVMSGMEEIFGTPVLEGYGMTEAYQIACNPLPPRRRKPGSVGIATGTEIAIINEEGNKLSVDEPGEVIVRGPNVMKGYDNDRSNNSNTFIDGWLRTGDLGYMDGDGYLFITGRIKEMINRGGEKISPYEVEEALLSHPSVREAVAFPVPDIAMGEEIGAAVVLNEGAEAASDDIRRSVAERLAYFKVPYRIFIVDYIPKSPIGKMQRLGMAERLGIMVISREWSSDRGYTIPSTETEKKLVEIWSGVLQMDRICVHDNFFDLGGDSLLAVQILSRIRAEFLVELPFVTFMEAENIITLAHAIDDISVKERDAVSRK